MSNSQISIHSLRHEHLNEVVRIHRKAFPESAFSLMGYRVCERYYRWQMVSQRNAYSDGAFLGGRLIAYCYYGSYKDSVTGFIYKNRLLLVASVAFRPWLLLKPELWLRIKKAAVMLKELRLRNRRTKRRISYSENNIFKGEGAFGILSIATDPEYSGAGAASMLMIQAEEQARKDGKTRMHLTVAVTNVHAISFYEKRGWRKAVVHGLWDGMMVKDIVST